MDNNLLIALAGVLLSLGFGYIPGLRDWYDMLDSVRKAQVMAVLLLAGAVGVYLAGCYTPYSWVTCDEAGFWELVELLIFALVANQATYLLAVRSNNERRLGTD